MTSVFNFEYDQINLLDWFTPETLEKVKFTEEYFRTFDSNEVICGQGAPVDYIVFLVRGNTRVYSYFKNGKRIEMDVISAPYLIGEMELLSNKDTYQSSVEAYGPCSCFMIPIDIYEECMNDVVFANKVSVRMASMLVHRSNKSGSDLAYPNEGVLLRYFLELLEENPSTPEFCLMNQTRRRLSERTGIAERTLNRLLSKFDESGLISIRRGKICLSQDKYESLSERLEEL